MDSGLLLARLVLATVFGVAGVVKLLDRAGTERALAGFGIPPRLTPGLAVGLPLAELAVAAALVVRPSAWWGGLGALGLLLAFTVVIARSLARGERPDCRCFGQLRAVPVGWPTLLRNVALAVLAAVVVGLGWRDPGPSVVGWLDSLPPAERALAILGVVALGFLAVAIAMLAYLLGQQGRMLARLDAIETRIEDGIAAPVEREEARPPDKGLPVGAPAPAFELPGLGGTPRTLASLAAPGQPILLLFVSPSCDPCVALLPEIGRWQREHADRFTLALVSSGSADDNRAKFGALPAESVLLQAGNEVADAYASAWTPGAVLLGPARRIASPVAYGDEAIRALVAHAAARPGAPYMRFGPKRGAGGRGQLPVVGPRPPRPGEPAPPIALSDLDGRTIDLRDYRGRDTLVLFWRPGCSFCQRLIEDVRRWEVEPPRGAPRLLVVSSESVEANRALGFRSSIVLDEGFAVGKAFGARGTPSAVLVDAEGRIASSVAVGGRDVLALAGIVPIVSGKGTPRLGA
jgi:thiol-disulfide isomerase/thioredoxin